MSKTPTASECQPPISGDITRRTFLVGGATTLLLAGCGNGGSGEQEASDTRTIEHKFGSTELPADARRIVTAGYNEADFALALGVVPVGVRDFIGPFREASRPWARDELGDTNPEVVGGEEINFEAVAALEPDLILAIYSFIDRNGYELLSGIAPTIAQPGQYSDGGTPWQEQTRITGRTLGREARAEEVVDDVESQFAKAREQHPGFEGKTAAVTLLTEGEFYILEPTDLRTRLFTSLGFRMPDETGAISQERVDLLDQDVLVVLGTGREAAEDDELIQSLDVVREGRVIYFGDFGTDFSGALGFSSPLSLPFALDIAVPQLAAAIDSDPNTQVTE